MERKSIGSFMAALRKTNGMTQQEVADHLNVSNKTVSKWERDESYPEITLIPVIAELFGVTSDEILRGERLSKNAVMPDRPDTRTDKQIKWIIGRSITHYKNMSYISLALIFVGLVCLFTISYALYRPVLAYGAFLVFVTASVLLEVIQYNNSSMQVKGNDIFDGREEQLIPLLKSRNRHTLIVILVNITAVIFSLPLILFRSETFGESVILIRSYIAVVPLLGITASAACNLFYRIANRNFAAKGEGITPELFPRKRLSRMNRLHGCCLVLEYLIITQVQYGEAGRASGYLAVFAILAPGLIIAASVIVFIITAKGFKEKVIILLAGIRNLLYNYIGLYIVLLIIFRLIHSDGIISIPDVYFLMIWVGLTVTVGYDIFSYKAYHKQNK